MILERPHMISIPALGASPVAFTDAQGQSARIPLSHKVYFDSRGINASNWPAYYSYKNE